MFILLCDQLSPFADRQLDYSTIIETFRILGVIRIRDTWCNR